ncbi:MAG: TetR/AcrR family transcriptional regulator, partial [Myxococcota bacterium]
REHMPRTAKAQRPDWGTAREALLEAAAQEFAENGFRGASVSRIAKRTGVTQPLINHHFGSKDGLWRAVLDWTFADMEDALAEAMDPALSNDEQLIEIVRQIVHFFARKPELARIVTTETNHPSEAFDYLFTKYLKPMLTLTQALLKKAKKEGNTDLDPRLVHFIVVGAAMQPFTEAEIARRAFGMEPFSAKYTRAYADTLCEVLMRGINDD